MPCAASPHTPLLPSALLGLPSLTYRLAETDWSIAALTEVLERYLGPDYRDYGPRLAETLGRPSLVKTELPLVYYQGALTVAYALNLLPTFRPRFIGWSLATWRGLLESLPSVLTGWACSCLRWEDSHLIEALLHFRPLALMGAACRLGVEVPAEHRRLWKRLAGAVARYPSVWRILATRGLPVTPSHLASLSTEELSQVHESLLDTRSLPQPLPTTLRRSLYLESAHRRLWELMDYHRGYLDPWLADSKQVQELLTQSGCGTVGHRYDLDARLETDYWTAVSLLETLEDLEQALAHAVWECSPETVVQLCQRAPEPLLEQALVATVALPEHHQALMEAFPEVPPFPTELVPYCGPVDYEGLTDSLGSLLLSADAHRREDTHPIRGDPHQTAIGLWRLVGVWSGEQIRASVERLSAILLWEHYLTDQVWSAISPWVHGHQQTWSQMANLVEVSPDLARLLEESEHESWRVVEGCLVAPLPQSPLAEAPSLDTAHHHLRLLLAEEDLPPGVSADQHLRQVAERHQL